ncbi:Histidine phosphatase superfamily [Trinorchestia longiramus]|nr:Histidine phosphatase superfamily [Trinorchestia longiramus]
MSCTLKSLLLALLLGDACQGCHYLDANPYRNFGVFTDYQSAKLSLAKYAIDNSPQAMALDCAVLSYWQFSREGASLPAYGIVDPSTTDALLFLKSMIIESHQLGRGLLCSEDLSALVNWGGHPVQVLEAEEELSNVGASDLYSIARRYTHAFFGDFYDFTPGNFRVMYSPSEASYSSALSIVYGMAPASYHHAVSPQLYLKESDDLTQYKCRLTTEVFIGADTSEEMVLDSVTEEVRGRLGLRGDLFTKEHLHWTYDACRAAIAVNPVAYSPWCAIFSKENLATLELVEDSVWYRRLGLNKHHYHEMVNYELMPVCRSLRHLLEYFRCVRHLLEYFRCVRHLLEYFRCVRHLLEYFRCVRHLLEYFRCVRHLLEHFKCVRHLLEHFRSLVEDIHFSNHQVSTARVIVGDASALLRLMAVMGVNAEALPVTVTDEWMLRLNPYQHQYDELTEYKIHTSVIENHRFRLSKGNVAWKSAADSNISASLTYPSSQKTDVPISGSAGNSVFGKIDLNQDEDSQDQQVGSSQDDCMRIPPPNYYKEREFDPDRNYEGISSHRNSGLQNPEVGHLPQGNEREKWFEDIDLSLYGNFFYSSAEDARSSDQPWLDQAAHNSSKIRYLSTVHSESSANFTVEPPHDFKGMFSTNRKILLPSPDIGETNWVPQNTMPEKQFAYTSHLNAGCEVRNPTNTGHAGSTIAPLSSKSKISDIFTNPYSKVNETELKKPVNYMPGTSNINKGARRFNNPASCASSTNNCSTTNASNKGTFVQDTDTSPHIKKVLLPNPSGRRTLLPTPALCRPFFSR